MSKVLEPPHQIQAWYKIGMVWFAIGLPALVVVASLVTMVIAHKNAPMLTSTKVLQTKIGVAPKP